MKLKFSFLLLLCCIVFSRAALAQQTATTFVLNQAPCNANGIITATFSNLTPPLTVSWHVGGGVVTHTNVSTLSDVLTGYAGGAFYITATDANSVAADGYYAGAPPFTYVTSVAPAVCPAQSMATATVTGGAAPYTYQWIDVTNSNVLSTSNPAPLPDGNYNIMITDANGCTFGSAYKLNPDSIFVHATAPFDFAVNATQANCTNGTATVASIAGPGTPPYTYLWSNGATSSSINSLTAGYYSVVVTDALGCHRDHGEQVNQAITIGANITATQPTCLQNNGALMAFGSGGTPPYSYLYSNGGTTQTQSNLTPNSYTVLVTDANGCTGTGFSYLYPTSPIDVTYTTVPSSCSAPTGSITLWLLGGQAPYTVSWGTFPAQSGVTASGLAPGNYSFHVTDANGCVATGTVPIPPVTVINATLTGTPATCLQANGAVTVSSSGGTAPYSYLWSNGATGATVTGLAAGSYSVQITDAAGCSVNKFKLIESSSPVHTGLATTPASCIYTNDGSVAATVWGGTTPYTYSWSNGQNTATATSLAAGNYWLSITDANGCTAGNFSHVGYGISNACYCTITGTVYHDANNNCTQDPGEAGIPNIQIHCAGFGYAYTNALGVYSFQVPTGTYTLSETVQSIYPLAACQNNAIVVNATAAAGCTQTVNFANGVNTIHDIHVSTWNNSMPVPGNPYSQTCIISNQGTVSESNILAGYHSGGQLNAPVFSPGGIFAPAGTNGYSTSGNTFPLLIPSASQAFSIQYNVPTNIPMGTGLVFRDSAVHAAPMSNWLNDYTPWNNVCTYNTAVVSSYDPNFKEVNPKGQGPMGNILRADSVLEYMIHFQNLGTYEAQNVVVIDTLDSNLDWSSLRPIYSSHAAKVSIDEHGVMKYTFKDIHLPAEMYNAAGSNGMFSYSIKMKPNLPLGTQIWNYAGIYFDYNEPVITNGVVNTLVNTLGVDENRNREKLSFQLYPNPTRTGFTAIIENKVSNAPASLTITDISGRILLVKEMNLQPGKQLIGMATGSLTAGVYFVNLNLAGKKSTQKLVIVK